MFFSIIKLVYIHKSAPGYANPAKMSQPRPLPTLKELHHDPETAFANDQLKLLLNQPPHASWIKKNKYAKNAEYLPIDKTEFLLDYIFQEWRVEVKDVAQLFNSVRVTVRLHYKNPVLNEWSFHDGVGAKTLQSVSESGPLKTDWSNISVNACEMALPIAKSAAIKDAADHLGKLFGRDLNRKGTVAFYGAYDQPGDQQPQQPTVTYPQQPQQQQQAPAPQQQPQQQPGGFSANDL